MKTNLTLDVSVAQVTCVYTDFSGFLFLARNLALKNAAHCSMLVSSVMFESSAGL